MFAIAKTKENIELFNAVFNLSKLHGKLITNIKLASDKILFDMKDSNPFVMCDFLTADQNIKWINIIIDNG